MEKIFKHSVKDIFLVAQTLLAITVAYTMAAVDLNIFWYLLITPLHILLILNVQNTSLHHHTHWATFNNKSLNSWYELLIAAAAGSKPQSYRHVHTIHHKYVNDLPVNGVSKDGISVFAHGQDGELENVWKFCYRNAKNAWSQPWKYVLFQIWKAEKVKTPMMNFVQWRKEQFSIVVFFLSILALNIVYGLWLLFVIYFVSHFANYSWHYGEHYGSYHYRGDTTQDSVGIYSKWYNTLCFKSGYHQEHHHRPGTHWTKLDEITPLLPSTRIVVDGMHVTNVPWVEHFKLLFKS